MIFPVQVHYRKVIEYEEDFHTASEAVEDFHKLMKKWRNKNATLLMKDAQGNRILLKYMNHEKINNKKRTRARRF